jgi:hypothetical protein
MKYIIIIVALSCSISSLPTNDWMLGKDTAEIDKLLQAFGKNLQAEKVQQEMIIPQNTVLPLMGSKNNPFTIEQAEKFKREFTAKLERLKREFEAIPSPDALQIFYLKNAQDDVHNFNTLHPIFADLE